MNDMQTITSVEDMPAIARDIVTKYCDRNGIEENDIFPSIWNDIISELYFELFRPCHRLLKLENSQFNEYDRSKVYYIYERIYKRLSNSHCQEITLKGFCDMIGIPKQTLYNWASDNKYIYSSSGSVVSNSDSSMCDSELLSISRFDLHEKIMSDNEESLFALMKDRRMNPMKVLPKLNKVHGWNMAGVSAQATKQALTSEDVKALLSVSQGQKAIEQTEPQDIVVSEG